MQSASRRLHSSSNVETIASPPPDMRDMLAALVRLEKHTGQFECEVDTVEDEEWDRISSGFEDLSCDQIARFSAGLWGDRVSHLLLRRHGEPVAGARIAIFTLPGFRRGMAFLRFGPFWCRHGEPADFTIYRAAIGAVVHEYCIRRGHFLTVIPRAHQASYAQEIGVLAEFGFRARRRITGEFDYWARPWARVVGETICGLQTLQRTIRHWRYGP